LLYVALTRAESRLVICGHQVGSEKSPAKETSWYDWMGRVFARLETKTIKTPFGDGHCFGKLPSPVAQEVSPISVMPSEADIKLPDWALQIAVEETASTQRLSPSHLLSEEEFYDSARTEQGLSPKKRGVIIHQLLEVLPNLSPLDRAEKAERILSGFSDLSDDDRGIILSEVFAVLNGSEFSFLWDRGSLAEANLVGQINSFSKTSEFTAQIDRLCLQGDRVIIVDYKSNRKVPETEDGIDRIYWAQMAAYRGLVQSLYPKKKIECALLWTSAPRLMWLSSQKLDHALTQIDSLLT